MSATLSQVRAARFAQRKRVNYVATGLALAAMAFGLFWLIWILVETVRLGLGGLSLAVFTEMTPPPMAEDGGLLNAIFGSALMEANNCKAVTGPSPVQTASASVSINVCFGSAAG